MKNSLKRRLESMCFNKKIVLTPKLKFWARFCFINAGFTVLKHFFFLLMHCSVSRKENLASQSFHSTSV